MNKAQFLAAIRERISSLPQSDINRSLDYYAEMIDDHIEAGLTEDQAVEAMGTIDEAVSQILMDTPFPQLIKAKVRPDRRLRVWEILLLAIGSPVWASLLLAAVAVCLAVYAVIWSLVAVLYAVDLSFAAGALAGVAGTAALALTGNFAQAVFFFGAGLICAGIAILLFFASNQGAKGVVRLSKWAFLRVKSFFIRKENVK